MKTLEDLKLNNQEHYKLEMNIGISHKDRETIAEGLSNILADSYALMVMSHNYHWNIRGKNFRQIHLLTEEQYTDLFTAVDEIAERVRSLGFIAPGSFSEFAERSHLDAPDSTASENQMLADLLKGNEHIAKHARKVIGMAAEISDEATADLLTSRVDVHEKNAWMLRSMLEE